MEILEIDEANWSENLDEFDPTETLTASVRTVIDDPTHATLAMMRERAPDRWARYSFEDIIEGR